MNAPTPDPGSPVHLASIDALRGLAFLAVLIVHTAQAIPAFPCRAFMEAGAYGVSLFFIASAYTLLASHYQRQTREPASLSVFFIRRLFRILPLFWAGIALYFILYGTWSRNWAEGPLSGFHYVLTATLLHGWHPDTINSVVPGGWSIAAECGFYALAPWLFLVLSNWRRALLAYAITLLFSLGLNSLARGGLVAHLFPTVPIWRQGSFTWLWLPAHLPTFILGFLAYHLRDRVFTLTAPARRLLLLTTCGALLASAAWMRGLAADYLFPPLLTLFVLALIASPAPALVNRFICLVGTLSFSAYINHFAALHVVQKVLPRFLNDLHSFHAFAVLFLGALLLTLLASGLTYHAIEKPGIALGRRLIQRLRRPLAPAATAP